MTDNYYREPTDNELTARIARLLMGVTIKVENRASLIFNCKGFCVARVEHVGEIPSDDEVGAVLAGLAGYDYASDIELLGVVVCKAAHADVEVRLRSSPENGGRYRWIINTQGWDSGLTYDDTCWHDVDLMRTVCRAILKVMVNKPW